jgi:hypothetical protein
VTAKIPRRAAELGRRAYDSDAADGPVVRGVRVRTAARTRGPRAGGASECERLGQRVPWAARGLGRRGRGRRGAAGARPGNDLLVLLLK